MKVIILALMCMLVMAGLAHGLRTSPPTTLPVHIWNTNSFTNLKSCNRSALYRIDNVSSGNGAHVPHPYAHAPLLVKLQADSRHQVGYDYASLLAEETSFTYNTFLRSIISTESDREKLERFIDWLWSDFYQKHIPTRFLEELEGMAHWWNDHDGGNSLKNITTPPHIVSKRFFVLANMPADSPNVISALEQELERGWPTWLKDIVNEIIRILENMKHHCDSYGVWGSRTENGRLYTSRNLDYNSDTGINRYKLLVFYDLPSANPNSTERRQYVSMGFTFGLGALAGQNMAGITTSEMNLDNSVVTFSGLPFPLRLRYVLEESHDLESAMSIWNSTNNTNSFNFLIGSAADGSAYALETIMGFTAQFPADSPIEADAFYPCGEPPKVDPTCHKWAPPGNQTGNVRIGFPLPDAVWRTNHGFNPRVMKTQEPLFNDTVFRYNLMHDLFKGFGDAQVPIGDRQAVEIVATLGTKGSNFLTCDQVLDGSNVLSVAYVPGEHRFFVAWEDGSGSSWRPAACATYLHVNMSYWFSG